MSWSWCPWTPSSTRDAVVANSHNHKDYQYNNGGTQSSSIDCSTQVYFLHSRPNSFQVALFLLRFVHSGWCLLHSRIAVSCVTASPYCVCDLDLPFAYLLVLFLALLALAFVNGEGTFNRGPRDMLPPSTSGETRRWTAVIVNFFPDAPRRMVVMGRSTARIDHRSWFTQPRRIRRRTFGAR